MPPMDAFVQVGFLTAKTNLRVFNLFHGRNVVGRAASSDVVIDESV